MKMTEPMSIIAVVSVAASVHVDFFVWLGVYIVLKLGARLLYQTVWKTTSWDMVCLIHNVFSVLVGCITVYQWELDQSILGMADSTCRMSLTSPEALVVMLQAVHSLSDFICYPMEMIASPIFIFHHGVLLFASLILPHCPGCVYFVIAFSLAEFGSLSIAVDGEWRKTGGKSRGLKRVVVFGSTRLMNLYLLYKIYEVTPSTTYFTLSTTAGEIATVNIPVCMITSVGSSAMMLVVNGVTWWRMWHMFLKLRRKRKGALAGKQA